MNKERISKIIGDIEKFIGEYQSMKIKNIDDLNDTRDFYSLSMILLTILNRTIDLGDQVLIEKKLGFPSKYKEIFELLYDGKIIDSNLKETLIELVHSRNLLAHEYQTFTRKDVFQISKKINVVNKFIDVVKNLYKSNNKKSNNNKNKTK